MLFFFYLVHLIEFGIWNMERLMPFLIQCVIYTSVSVHLNLDMFVCMCVCFYSSMFLVFPCFSIASVYCIS